MPLYCFLCCHDDLAKHAHQPKVIAIDGDSAKSDWQNLRSKVADTLSKANDWF
jgi:hypothetical protein